MQKIVFKIFLSHKMAREARMRDMSRFLAQVSLRVAVSRVTAEGLPYKLLKSCSASLPGGNLVDGLPPVVSC